MNNGLPAALISSLVALMLMVLVGCEWLPLPRFVEDPPYPGYCWWCGTVAFLVYLVVLCLGSFGMFWYRNWFHGARCLESSERQELFFPQRQVRIRFGWKPQQTIFLDALCIDQLNDSKKSEAGISLATAFESSGLSL